MKVQVDFDVCESNGLCEGYLSSVFELDDDDLLQVHREEVLPDEEAAAQQAARACPRQAIAIQP